MDVRLRHYHRTERGRVIDFTVQLESLVSGRWRPIVRYDSAHGHAHRHCYHGSKKAVRESLSLGFPEALTFAEMDLRDNWERYLEEYRI
jgi:hypothetical protein